MTMNEMMVTCPSGSADLLASELKQLGALDLIERPFGCRLRGDLQLGYRICLHSRLASRVHWVIHRAQASDAASLYDAAKQVMWADHIGVKATFAIDLDAHQSGITHTQFAALKVKDAIVDQLRERRGERPNVAVDRPSVRVHVLVMRDEVTFSIDLSGEGLHRRGWRDAGVAAPLKENLAASLLIRCGYGKEGQWAMMDPMCGSGSLVIEAALIASNRAPGLTRPYFGFQGWSQHEASLWERLVREARESILPAHEPICFGSDVDARVIDIARASARLTGVAEWTRFEHRPLSAIRKTAEHGLIITNPPYGERIGEADRLGDLYTEIGEVWRARFEGWQGAVLTADAGLGKRVGIRAHRTHKVMNGPIEARLLRFKIEPDQFFAERVRGRLPTIKADWAEKPGAVMFANRLRKNREQLGKWARRESISCYRVYDADMPEYAFAIDEYAHPQQPDQRYVFVQEYQAPASISEEAVKTRRLEALSVLPQTLGVAREAVWFRTRKRQRGSDQYQKVAEQGEFYWVGEGGLEFQVNFDDFQDTGIFLDHRLTRGYLRTLAKDQRFLNLFAYTGSASVYAAAGHAASVTSVDMSRTYLDWARRNLEKNGFHGRQYNFIQADALEWIREAPAQGWDLIFLDPPTFSNSKRMQDTLDIQRDHVKLIDDTLRLLAPGGRLVFSTNYTRFQLEWVERATVVVKDLSKATIPKDYERHARIHRCFEFHKIT